MILNLTQHKATDAQLEAGVVEPSEEGKQIIQRLLTFESIPSAEEIVGRSKKLGMLAWSVAIGAEPAPVRADDSTKAMIGGAPFLMASLESALMAVGITPVYAFSRRESTEVDDGDGGIRKVATFRHLGFVDVSSCPDPFQAEKDSLLRENLLPHFPESFVDDVITMGKGEDT